MDNGRRKGTEDHAKRFRFPMETFCGYMVQGNGWTDDWVEFFIGKLQEQLGAIVGDEAERQWVEIKPNVPGVFEGLVIEPALSQRLLERQQQSCAV